MSSFEDVNPRPTRTLNAIKRVAPASSANTRADLVECLQIEPTTRCNFTCGFCIGRYMEQTDLKVSVLEKTLPHVHADGVVELQGEGEPLLLKDFFSMLALCTNGGKREVSTITNGSLLNESNAQALVDQGLHHVAISLESPNEAEFKRLRGGSWDKVRRGIETLLRVRADNKNPTVGFAVAVLRSTMKSLDSICDLYEELGCDGGIMFQPLQAMPVYASIYGDEMSAEMLDDNQFFAFEEWIEQNSRARALVAQAETRSFYGRLDHGWTPQEQTCRWLTRGLYVDRDGYASACCKVKNTNMAFGNVLKDSWDSIISARKNADQEFRQGRTPAFCAGCVTAGAIYQQRYGKPPKWDPKEGASQLIPSVSQKANVPETE